MGSEFPLVRWSEFDGEADAWDALLQNFNGATLYQSHAWGEVRRALGWRPVRLIASDGSKQVVSLAQVLVRRVASGVALCWVPGGAVGELSALGSQFRSALAGIIDEPLVYCRMNMLRPFAPELARSLFSEGWVKATHLLTTGLSLDYDLRPEEPDRLGAASGNWRHNLRRSTKYGLIIERWDSPVATEIFNTYKEMEILKGLGQQHSLQELTAIIKSLGERLIIFRCLDSSGRMIALRGCGILGVRAWDLLAAASPTARKFYASHALLWALTAECRRLGVQSYDLSGVDPAGNKGVYDFKKGTGSVLVQHLGEWEWANFPGLRQVANLAMRYRKGAM